MTPVLFVAVALAGGLGATLRLVVDGGVRARVRTALPVGTLLINVVGSLLLGLITGLALALWLPGAWHLVLGGGLLGGFTTFSTASYESVRLAQDRRSLSALFNGFGMLALSVGCSFFGLWLGLGG
ncbi:chromosome condensation protein CrcB [Cryobacterium adonitolivorans]|uniref:Fluoride-specific ion channel FluC n=1 Tax=Cryobacterium adonitolivorans TaxID=1259189 RepID=A0A4R8VYR6_9MICO|nr:CrcB family protein [Cryobacterium adonitolivorans]TFB98704.1 chromosome condensation protein CrcB [Cryobacterium adonitolivorans]